MELIKDFIEMSRIAGMRRDLVQAGGGNTSVKISDDVMIIKSSGVQLSELKEDYGLSYVNHKMIVNSFEENNEVNEQELLNACLIEGNRPSIETFLHALTQTFTLHSHSLMINIISSRIDGMTILKKIFPQALLISYNTPGLPLSKDIFKRLKDYRSKYNLEPQIIILKNHGLIVSADVADKCIELTNMVNSKIEQFLGTEVSKEYESETIYHYFKETESALYPDIIYWVDNEVIRTAFKANGKKMWDYQFCPDAIVYCGKKAFDFEVDNYDDFVQTYAKPVIIINNEEIYIRAANVKKAKDIESLLEFTAHVALINKNIEIDLLSDKEQNFLLNWDSEKYRQKM